ncbi:hypothetical protein ASG90_19960 [Nocardioides sp. Soil797]|nr:hypothetical protein ASG90_19960 [Nocardioides sp. Soil797]
MADTRCDMTHRAYELALGEGLGFWERSATVTSLLSATASRSGRRPFLGGGRKHKANDLMLHTFDGGLVVERVRGGVLGACYTTVTAGLLEIEPCPETSGPGLALSLTFDGSRTLLLMESTTSTPDELAELAGRCRASSRARMERWQLGQAFSDPDWI